MPEEFDFTPSRDYHSMWRNAMKIKNLDSLDLIFHSLCSEIGLSDDQATQSAGEALGKLAAERLNQRGKGPACKAL